MTNAIENQNENQNENRDMTTATHGTHNEKTVKLSEKIIDISKNQAGIAARIRLEAGVGRSKMMVDLENTPMTPTGEMNVNPTTAGLDPSWKEIAFIQERFTSANVISNQFETDNKVGDYHDYMLEVHAKRAVLTIEQGMFELGSADGGTGFQNILLHNNATASHKVEDIFVKTSAAATVAYDELFDAYLQFIENNPGNLLGGVIVVENVKAFAAIKDGNGISVLTFDKKEDGTVGTAFGMPVLKATKFVAGTKTLAVFMNPEKSYGAKLGNGQGVSGDHSSSDVTRVISGDTTQAIRGSKLYLGDIYAAGKVINPRAILLVKTI